MFRKGGSAGEGITSGLAPRQGYKGTGNAADQSVQPFDLSKLENIRDLNPTTTFTIIKTIEFKTTSHATR